MTLVQLEIQTPQAEPPSVYNKDGDGPARKSWLIYAPLLAAIFLILIPHPSFFLVLTSYYLSTRHAPLRFGVYLLGGYTLTFLVFSSLMVCVVRDPGRLGDEKNAKKGGTRAENDREDDARVGLLLSQDDNNNEQENEDDGQDVILGASMNTSEPDPTYWCRQCRIVRPERAHHCSTCGRCVLRMDHHCPWLGGNCVGHRTYPAFVHFILCCTLLALYMTCLALNVVVKLVQDPFSIDPNVSPLHALFLVLMGSIFTLTMSSFLVYHMYLISTNQTTIEHMSPHFLLRHLPRDTSIAPPKRQPPPPSSPHGRHKVTASLAEAPTPPDSPLLSPRSLYDHSYDFPLQSPTPSLSSPIYTKPISEDDLTHGQRRIVRATHGRLRVYDLGFWRNWRVVFGGGHRGWRGWVRILLYGGFPRGDGWTWERGRGTKEGLERLARRLREEGTR